MAAASSSSAPAASAALILPPPTSPLPAPPAPGTSSAATLARNGTEMYVWEDVVRRHFADNGNNILNTVNKWKGRKMVGELTEAMKKHGFLDA